MMSITQDEVRRHPRWRKEMDTPSSTTRAQRMPGVRLLGAIGVVIVLTALTVLLVSR
jgi:hypothetical protein